MTNSGVRFDHLFAGLSGGVLSTAVLHPLDLIKIRLQVNDGSAQRPIYRGAIDCARQVFRSNGVRGLYQGVVPNIWGAGLSWGFYFFFYNNIKQYMQHGDSKTSLSAGWHMLAAAQSGFLTLSMTNPIWVAKTRMCLQYDHSRGPSTRPQYSSLAGTLRAIWSSEGVAGLYKGFVPGIFGISHGVMQFVAYEELKKLYFSHYGLPADTRLGTFEYIVFAALSKMFAVVTTYPYQVVRSRLQEQHRQHGSLASLCMNMFRSEGWRGFYKGLVPNLLRVTPACCITFAVYESLITWLRSSDQ